MVDEVATVQGKDISDLRDIRIAVALSDLSAFLECLTSDTIFDKSGALRLTEDRGILVFLETDSDKLMYTVTLEELLQAHASSVEWTRMLGKIGEWVRDVVQHYTRVRKSRAQTFSFETSEAQGIVDEIGRLRLRV